MARDKIHRQNVARAQVRLHMGHDETRIVCQMRAKPAQRLCLAQVIGFLVQLRRSLGQQAVHVKALGHHARGPRNHAQIAHVAVDAVAHARILHLDGKIAPILGLRAMHLPDRGGGNRLDIKALEMAQKILAPFRRQHLFQLRGWHEMPFRAQPRQDCGHLGRHQIGGFHRQKLPGLHRRTAHPGQLIRNAGSIARRHQQIGQHGFAPAQQLQTATRRDVSGKRCG